MLFNIYFERIFQLALESVATELKVNGKPINTIRYADDITFLANYIENFQNMVDWIVEKGVQFRLRTNIAEPKMIIISR